MTRQEQIEEMAKIVDEMYNVYTTTADDIADGLYNAGYRKTFTSDLASDTQKAFKEGYEKGCEACAQSWDNGYNDGFEDGKEQAYKDCYDITRKETAKKIISAMKTMIINRRADERSGLNTIYTTYSPERLFDDILDYVRIAMGVEVEE